MPKYGYNPDEHYETKLTLIDKDGFQKEGNTEDIISDYNELREEIENRGIPSGGESGQMLTKASNDDYDVEWSDIPSFTENVETTVTNAANTWLQTNITNPSNPPLDSSLSLSNAAAPADKVGELKSAIHAKKINATYVNGKAWRANTNVETSGNYQYAKYQINGETEFVICGHAFDSAGKWPAVSYLNVNNETIATDKITKGYYSVVKTVVPENATYIVVNGEGPNEPTNDPTGPLIYAVSSEIVADEIARLDNNIAQKYGFVKILSGEDLLNEITQPGAYRWASTAAPADVPCLAGTLFVYGPSSSSFTGKGAIVIASTGEIYARMAISSGWTNWTRHNAVLIDDSLTVQGSAADAKAVGDQLAKIPSVNVFDDYIAVSGTITDGYAKRTSGTDTSNDLYVYGQYTVTPGEKVMLSGYHYANTYPLYLAYDSNDTLLESATYSTAGIYSLIYEIPENASYIIVNGSKDTNKGGNAYPDVRRLVGVTNLHNSLLAEKVKRRYLFMGDSYCAGYTHGVRNAGWAVYCAEYMGLGEGDYVRSAVAGSKFRTYGEQFINNIPINYPADYFTDIVLCGGYNDRFDIDGVTDKEAELLTGMQNVCNVFKEKYPYAKIHIGFIAYSKQGTGEGAVDDWLERRNVLINNVLPAYQKCTRFGAAYLTNVEYWINDSGLSPEDGYHPNEAGNRSIGQAVAHALLSGSAPLPHNEAYRMPTD